MADTSNLSSFLGDVANAIRTKKGTTETIPAANFDTEIRSIPTGTVLEKVVAEASEVVEEETDVKVVSTPLPEPIVIPENGVAEVLTDKALLAENIGLTADKILEGNNVLGIEGTGKGGADTSKVTAMTSDVRCTKKYVDSNGDLVQGTFPDITYSSVIVGDASLFSTGKLNTVARLTAYFDSKLFYFDNGILYCNTMDLLGSTYSINTGKSNVSYIDVGCKNTLSNNTVAIALSSNSTVSLYLYNTENNTFTFVKNFNVEYNGVGIDYPTCTLAPNKNYMIISCGEIYNSSNSKAILYEISSNYELLYKMDINGNTNDNRYNFRCFGGWFNDTFIKCRDDVSQYYTLPDDLNTIQLDYVLTSYINSSDYSSYTRMGDILGVDSSNSYALKFDYSNSKFLVYNLVKNGTVISLGSVLYEVPVPVNYESNAVINGDLLIVSNNHTLEVYKLGKTIEKLDITMSNISLLRGFRSNDFIVYGNALYVIKQSGTEVITEMVYNDNSYVNTSDATATANDILSGTTAYVNDNKVEGNIPNNGELNITPSKEPQSIPAGYTSGGTVAGDTNLLPENIKSGTTIFGVNGTLEVGIDTSDATATANDIAKNKTAYVNGEKVTGNVYDLNSGNWMVHTIRLYGQDMLSFTNGTSSVLVRANGSFVANFNEIAPVIGLTADKIVSGNTILGVAGTAETGDKLPDNVFIQSDVPTKTTDEAIWLKEELLWSPDAYIGGGKYIKNFVEQLTDEQKILFNKYPYKMGMDRNGQLFAVVASENPAVITTYDSNYINFDGSATNNNISISYRSSNSTWSVSESTTINVNVNKRNGGSMSYSNYDIYDKDGVKKVNSKSSVPIVEEGLHIENGEKRYTVYYSNGTDFEKILDTSNADATAGDIVEGKTAFVNNTKITGTLTVPMSQEEYNTALSTANDILGNTSDTFVLLNDMPNGELKEYLRIPKSFLISDVGMNKLSNLGTDNLHCTNIDIDGGAGYFLINHIGSDNMYFDLCLEMAYFAQWNYNSSTGMFELDDTRNGDEIATVEGDYVYLSNPNGIMIKNGDIDTDIWGMIFIDTSK